MPGVRKRSTAMFCGTAATTMESITLASSVWNSGSWRNCCRIRGSSSVLIKLCACKESRPSASLTPYSALLRRNASRLLS